MSEELERIRKIVWDAAEKASPRDVAPLARILLDLERDGDAEQAGSALSQLEERRKRRAAGG